MIFNWISRCWGGMGINTQFEKARINCCIADWTVPYQDDILILITSFQDKNPQIPAKTAINTFLSHLQTDQQKAHPAFLLKHLYVLDHCVQEMTALDIIGYYYNSNLSASKSHKNIQINDPSAPLRQLINSYYTYLIAKARVYSRYENTYFCKDLKPVSFNILDSSIQKITSKSINCQQINSQISLPTSNNNLDFMYSSGKKKKIRECTVEQKSIYSLFYKQTSYNSIFDIIDKCQQVQKCISDMNKAYLTGNRKVQLTKFIFIMCLRTYIRCYLIVSVGIRFLFKDFTSMKIKQLQRFVKAFQYFNNEYTGDFIRFVQSNRADIDIFKQINYNQLTYLNKDGMKILIEYKQQLKMKQQFMRKGSFSSPNNLNYAKLPEKISMLPTDQIQQRKIFQLPNQVQIKIKQNMKIFYKPRKNMDFCLLQHKQKKINDPYIYSDDFQDQTMDSSFFRYQNFYNQSFNNSPTQGSQSPMLNSKKYKSVNDELKTKSAIIKLNSPNQTKGTNSVMQNSDYKNDLLLQKQSQVGQQVKQKMTKSAILGYNVQNKSKQAIKPRAMNEIRQMFEIRKKDFRVDGAWQQWQNEYADKNILAKN